MSSSSENDLGRFFASEIPGPPLQTMIGSITKSATVAGPTLFYNRRTSGTNFAGFPRRRGSRQMSLSLNELGTARIVFGPDYSSFEGAMVNQQEESYVLRGRPLETSPLCLTPSSTAAGDLTDGVDLNSADQIGDSSDSNDIGELEFDLEVSDLGPNTLARLPPKSDTKRDILKKLNVEIIESETALQYLIKNVSLHVKADGQLVQLRSRQISFETDEILLDAKADMEVNKFLSPDSVARLHLHKHHHKKVMHVGTMIIDFSTCATAPEPAEDTIAVADLVRANGAMSEVIESKHIDDVSVSDFLK